MLSSPKDRKIGRPRCNIDIDQVVRLSALNYSWTKIASMIGTSRATLYHHLKRAGVPCTDVSPLSDQHIDEIITEIKNDPNDGGSDDEWTFVTNGYPNKSPETTKLYSSNRQCQYSGSKAFYS